MRTPGALVLLSLFAVVAAGCETVPPPAPITKQELVELAKGGPHDPRLVHALLSRPLGFPLTYETLEDLEKSGVSKQVLDEVVDLSSRRMADSIAREYGESTWYPGPGYYWWPGFDFYYGVPWTYGGRRDHDHGRAGGHREGGHDRGGHLDRGSSGRSGGRGR